VERSRIETLATCQWIRKKRTLLIQGPPGVGGGAEARIFGGDTRFLGATA